MLDAPTSLAAVMCATAMCLSAAAPAHAQSDSLPRATINNVPHATADGLRVIPAEGNSLMGVYARGGHEIRFQVQRAIASGDAAAPVGMCMLDETGALLAGAGVDADNESYTQIPQVGHERSIDAQRSEPETADGLQQWCTQRTALVRDFVSLMRQLAYQPFAQQQALFQGRLEAWQIALSMAENAEGLCMFAAAQTEHGLDAAAYTQGF